LAEDAHQGEDLHYTVWQLQGLRTLADWDPMIQKAVTYLPEAQALQENVHKVLAQKAMARNTGPQARPGPALTSRSHFLARGHPARMAFCVACITARLIAPLVGS